MAYMTHKCDKKLTIGGLGGPCGGPGGMGGPCLMGPGGGPGIGPLGLGPFHCGCWNLGGPWFIDGPL